MVSYHPWGVEEDPQVASPSVLCRVHEYWEDGCRSAGISGDLVIDGI